MSCIQHCCQSVFPIPAFLFKNKKYQRYLKIVKFCLTVRLLQKSLRTLAVGEWRLTDKASEEHADLSSEYITAFFCTNLICQAKCEIPQDMSCASYTENFSSSQLLRHSAIGCWINNWLILTPTVRVGLAVVFFYHSRLKSHSFLQTQSKYALRSALNTQLHLKHAIKSQITTVSSPNGTFIFLGFIQ